MQRTPIWAAVAFFPLLVTVGGASAPESWSSPVVNAGPVVEFLTTWWWVLLGIPAILVVLYFLVHAAVGVKRAGVSRLPWVLGMVILGPLVTPAYWWVCSTRSDNSAKR